MIAEPEKQAATIQVAINATAHGRAERTDEISGRTVIRAPVTILNIKDQPIMNRLLYTESAVNESDWNGVRATNGHPESFVKTSATAIGNIQNAVYDTQTGRLNAVIIIDRAQCEAHNSLNLYNRVLQGEKMDVSCSVWLLNVSDVKGKIGDEEYRGVVKEIEPIHLAVLPDEAGACPQPHCGLNEKETETNTAKMKRWLKDFITKLNYEGDQTMSEKQCETCAAANSQGVHKAITDLTETVKALAEQVSANEENLPERVGAVLDERAKIENSKQQEKAERKKMLKAEMAEAASEMGIPFAVHENADGENEHQPFIASAHSRDDAPAKPNGEKHPS